MKWYSHNFLNWALLVASAGAFGQTAQTTISGRVIDSDGRAVAGATALAIPFGEGRLAHSVTDANGAYEIVTTYQGQLRVTAHKESDGYPNTLGVLFIGDESFPVVETMPGGVLKNVNIQLPPPDGILTGTVHDAQTGGKVPQARVTLRKVDAPDVMYSSYLRDDGTFLFALPPKPITLEITAPGYKTWRYVDGSDATRNEYLYLKHGSRSEISIELERDVPRR
jgi:hypothetical protein